MILKRLLLVYVIVSLALPTLLIFTPTTSAQSTVYTYRPSDDAYVEFPFSGDTHNYKCVDDVTPDAYTTYIATSLLNTNWYSDLYEIPDHTTETGQILNVSVSAYAETYSYTGAKLRLIIKTDGTTYFGDENTLGSSWTIKSYDWNSNPKTGLNWTWEDIDDLQIGVYAKSAQAHHEGYRACITQVYARIWVGTGGGGTGDNGTVYIENATSITTDTATLNGEYYPSNGTSTCGFWYGRTSPLTNANKEGNITHGTKGGGGDSNEFSNSTSGLTSGDYYYAKAWAWCNGNFTVTGNESYFLTKPTVPTNFQITNVGANNVSFSWTPATAGPGTTIKSVIRYKTGGYPSSPTDGTEGYNGTGSSTTITGISGTYYFRLWSFCNATGSPHLYQFSDSYISLTESPAGGNYNVSIRYENVSYGYVDLTGGEYHKLIVHYNNFTEENVYDGSAWVIDESGMAGDPSAGNISFNASYQVMFLEFYWNGTNGTNPYRCHRVIVPDESQRNVTFFVLTTTPIYGESSAYLNHSLVQYEYAFIDETYSFRSPNDPYAIIYTFDRYGNQQIIHSEYFDTSEKVKPMLLYGKKYYIGVTCDIVSYSRLGIAPSGSDLSPTVRIPYEEELVFNFYDLVDLDVGWYGDGFYVDYLETTGAIQRTYFNVTDYDTGATIHSENVAVSNYNFTFTTGEGCDLETAYIWEVTTILNHNMSIYQGTFTSGKIPIFPGMTQITSATSVDDMLELIFGASPMYNTETGQEVAWSSIGFGSICVILLLTFGKINAFLGSMAVSLFMLIIPAIVSGINALVIISAFLLLGISVIGLMGGVDKR